MESPAPGRGTLDGLRIARELSEATMTVLDATVLDPRHLELAEPLSLRAGARVSVTVNDVGGGPRVSSRSLGHRQREQEWRRTHGEVLRGYAGKWLVLEGEEIIAHGDDPKDLVRQARDRGIRSPYVFFVEPVQPGVVKLGI